MDNAHGTCLIEQWELVTLLRDPKDTPKLRCAAQNTPGKQKAEGPFFTSAIKLWNILAVYIRSSSSIRVFNPLTFIYLALLRKLLAVVISLQHKKYLKVW